MREHISERGSVGTLGRRSESEVIRLRIRRCDHAERLSNAMMGLIPHDQTRIGTAAVRCKRLCARDLHRRVGIGRWSPV